MKRLLIGALCAFTVTGLSAQSSHTTGSWDVTSGSYHYADPILKIRTSSATNSISILEINGESASGTSVQGFVEPTLMNFVLKMEDASGDSVSSMSISAVSAGNPNYLFGYQTDLNVSINPSQASFNCFIREGCRFGQRSVWLRPSPLRVVEEEAITIGAQSQALIELEEVRFTRNAIEVLLFFNTGADEYNGTLHPPGQPNTFFLRDSQGNRYDLMSQQGWPGPDQGRFGNYIIPGGLEENQKVHVILYFEPASDFRSVTNFSLIEGSCSSGCWSFYEVRLND